MKKLFAITLTLILVLCVFAFPASAAGSGSLSATSASGYRGDTVTVDVNLGSNPGLITMKFQVSYSANLTLVSVSNSGLLAGWTTPAPTIQSPYTLRWADSLSTTNNTAIGKVATLTFKINDNAAIGTETVTITFNESRDATGGRNSFNSTSASITINCRHSYGSWVKENDTVHAKTCSICQDVQRENHGWDNGTQTKNPSCKEEGEKTFSCSVCNGTKTEPVDKTDDHNYGDWVKVDGNDHTHTCSICQGTETVAHTWDNGVETKPATCKETGIMTYICTGKGCGATYTEDIPLSTQHTFGNLTAVDDVNHKDTCSVCQKEITEAHSYDNGVVTKPADCKEEGVMTYTCSGCQHTKTTPIDKTEDHKYGDWVKVDGNDHTHTCTVCQKTETATHTWNGGAVTKPANCKETGIKTFTCTAKGCGATYTEDIDKTEDHKYGPWTKVDADTHSRTCSVCEKVETGNHGYKTSWSSDRNGHWHECSVCKDRKDSAAHVPGPEATEQNPQRCTTCSYILKAALAHTHKWEDTWTIDEEGHYYACPGCSEHKDEAAHDFENDCDTLCETCGYTREITHNFSAEWTCDETGHWNACVICGEKENFAEHTAGAEATEFTAQTCTVCEYELEAALGHSFSEIWSSDTENHWHDCACGEKGSLAAHSYADGVCSVCGAEEPKNNIWIWIVIGVVAVAATVVVVIVIKKKKS